MMDTSFNTARKILLIATTLAVLGAVLIGTAVAGAQEQPPVDLELSMANVSSFTTPAQGGFPATDHHETVFVVSVRNNSDVTVRDIKVRMEVDDLTLGRSIKLDESFDHATDVNDGFLDTGTLEWDIPLLRSGITVTTKLELDVFNIDDLEDPRHTGNSLVRLQAAIAESLPRETPGHQGNSQARNYMVWQVDSAPDQRIYENVHLFPSLSYGVDADPGTNTFTVKVTNPAYNPYPSWLEQFPEQYLLRFKVTASEGLRYTATPPAGTTFNRATGIWNIGTLAAGSSPEGNKSLDILVTGTGGLPAEGQCLTVEVEHVVPEPESPWLPVTACMEHKALIASGLTALFHWHDCLTETAYPCDASPSLELTAVKPAFGLSSEGSPNERYAVADVHRGRLRSDDLEYARTNTMILQPEELVVHVPDHFGTRVVTELGETEWSTASLFLPYMDQTEFGYDWTEYKQSVTVSGVDGAPPPGRWRMWGYVYGEPTDFLNAPDGTKVEGDPYSYDDIPVGDRTTFIIAFETLGTYVALYEIEAVNDGTTYTDSGTYTFHVGPVAELEVRDDPAYSLAKPGQRAYNIVARNHGPDTAPVARVTLSGVPEDSEAVASQGSYAQGICGEDGLCEGVWTIGEMREAAAASSEGRADAEVLTIIPGAGANAEITATIENDHDYSVVIDGTRHTTKYYDYLGHNNEAQIALRSTPHGAMPGRSGAPEFLTVRKYASIAVLNWQPLELLNGRPVTHYQVERNGAMLADAVVGTVYADLQGGVVNQSYRVRAVNEFGVAGPWSLPAGAGGLLEQPEELGAPNGLTATPGLGDSGRIDLSWFAPSGETGLRYTIEHSPDGAGPWRTLARSHSGTTYSHTGLISGTTHHYRVSAVKGSLISPWAYAQATTEGLQIYAPGWPGNLRFSSLERTAVTLVWDPPVDDGGSRVTGYEYRVFGPCASGADTVCDIVAPTRVGSTTTSRRITGLNREGTYEFSVRALNAVGAGEWSQSITKDVGPATARGGRVILSPSRLTVTEGGEATYRVKLSSEPTLPLFVVMHWDGDGYDNLAGELPVQQFKILLPRGYDTSGLPEWCSGIRLDWDEAYAWNVGVPITVVAAEDDDSNHESLTIQHTIYTLSAECLGMTEDEWAADPVYDDMHGIALTVTERDND